MSEDFSEKTSVITGDTFSGKLKELKESPPALVVLMGPPGYIGKQWLLEKPEMVIGRDVNSHIYIDDKSVSRNHARIHSLNGVVTILDLGSANKTIINGQNLAPMTPYVLKDNDQLKAGNVIFKFLEKGNLEAMANQELIDKAQRDALTGVYSKGALLERGPEAMKRSEVLNEQLSIVVLDIDHFKKINDNPVLGHPAGDLVLKELAKVIGQKVVRAQDFFARYGGEEFVIILTGTDLNKAIEFSERLRVTVEQSLFEYKTNPIKVTISIGVAQRRPGESEWSSLFERADMAMYSSKHNGRNKVTAVR